MNTAEDFYQFLLDEEEEFYYYLGYNGFGKLSVSIMKMYELYKNYKKLKGSDD